MQTPYTVEELRAKLSYVNSCLDLYSRLKEVYEAELTNLRKNDSSYNEVTEKRTKKGE